MATYRFCWMRNESREMIMAAHFRRLRVKPSTKIKVLVQSFILEMGMSRGRNSSIPFETHRKSLCDLQVFCQCLICRF